MPDSHHVTIICDASLLRQHGLTHHIWGWAGMAISDYGRQMYSAPGKAVVENSNDCELYAVAGTILCMIREKGWAWAPGLGWLIQSDNMHVVRLVNWFWEDSSHTSRPVRQPSMTKAQWVAIRIIAWTIAMLGQSAAPAFIHCKHVKGHLCRDDPKFTRRHHVQADVDDEAGKMSRLAFQRSRQDA